MLGTLPCSEGACGSIGDLTIENHLTYLVIPLEKKTRIYVWRCADIDVLSTGNGWGKPTQEIKLVSGLIGFDAGI